MSGIRVTYSGLIAFVVGILGIITGLVFTMIITRSLTLTEFGSWSVIGSFEMPVLGYAGYLPFGLDCVAVAGLLRNRGG